MSRVSVIIVNYNAGEMLQQCVALVLASDVPVEVLVCDNASTDDSLHLLQQRFPQIQIQRNGRNLGFATAVNQGLARASGDTLLLLNPDCLVQPDTLSQMLKAVAGKPGWGMAGCRILNPDGTEQRGCRRRLPTLGNSTRKALGRQSDTEGMDLHQQELPHDILSVEAISGAFMLINPQALRDVGGMDEGYFLHCEDLDWCKRFHDKGWDILFVPWVSILHHQGHCSQAQPLRVEWHKHQGMARYYRKFLKSDHSLLTAVAVHLGIYGRFLLKAARLGVKKTNHA